MYYDINKIDSDKKFNIQIGERGIGQTYYLRQKYLLQLGFNINSIGFDFWLTAIRIYLKNRRISMTSLYNEIAKITNKKSSQIERAMRTASETAKENIKKLYDYNGKLSNKTILTLITKFEMKDNIDNHIPRVD
jgi:DNA replication protein DnaD